ncbi:ABC transporter permease [Melittangium boletus]|uniref:ABC transporter permease n=1 Tax=Melittangium boletus DSM 14713 TaxID=1294270 RepID=A0A250ISK0_9BACT|nr:FtsX-like permease family protein [Melittangium boletus]ATB34167.1 ABC transporter permease [Melittangium boletus DSM 14713]
MIPLYYNTRSLWARRLSTGITVLGLGLVVFVFAAVLMLANGIETALAAGGDPRNVILLNKGATSELMSDVSRDALRLVASLPQVASSATGEPLAAGELVVPVPLPHADGRESNVNIRGIGPQSFAIRPIVRLVAGRAPRTGTNELALGSSLVGRSPGARLGGELSFANQRWPVVGIFSAEGSAYESELWIDGNRLGPAFDRPVFNSIVVRTHSVPVRDAFMQAVKNDSRFTLDAKSEPQYWAEQATELATFIRVLGLFVSFIFGVGAVLGAMITMYAQVASRITELGMLRAVGFRRRSVLASVLIESAVLGTAGGVLGALGALATRWLKIRTLNIQTFTEVSFGFTPTPEIVVAALAFGALMGTLGGLLPALRAARLSILETLRA